MCPFFAEQLTPPGVGYYNSWRSTTGLSSSSACPEQGNADDAWTTPLVCTELEYRGSQPTPFQRGLRIRISKEAMPWEIFRPTKEKCVVSCPLVFRHFRQIDSALSGLPSQAGRVNCKLIVHRPARFA